MIPPTFGAEATTKAGIDICESDVIASVHRRAFTAPTNLDPVPGSPCPGSATPSGGESPGGVFSLIARRGIEPLALKI